MKNISRLFTKLGAWISTLPILLIPTIGFAADQATGGGLAGAGTELGKTRPAGGVGDAVSLPQLIGKLINVFLSVLGIIFVVLVVYAGWLYLSASGEEDKVKKAKKLLAQAVIGLVIIIAAFTIADFVIDNLVAAATT